ncbi:MAG: BLUF domain-containing protein [Sulfitobacter sp.]
MIRALYFSTANPTLTFADVDEMVDHAIKKNARLSITGALAYNRRNFCQVLEGQPDIVNKLLSEIEGDSRHSGFKLLDKKEVSERAFPDWSMRLVKDLDFSIVINAMRS